MNGWSYAVSSSYAFRTCAEKLAVSVCNYGKLKYLKYKLERLLWSEEDFGADIYPSDDRVWQPSLRFADALIGTVSLAIYIA